MTNDEILQHVQERLKRRALLEKSQESLESWWRSQLIKHHPLLAREHADNAQELHEIDQFLGSLGMHL